MTTIEQHRAEDYIWNSTHQINARVYGHVIRMEQRQDDHLIGSGINIHPGKDNFKNCLLDLQAIAKDSGKEFKIE